MNNIWTSLIAPVLVALIVGYMLKGIQEPERASIVAEVTWMDTPNPFASLDIKKTFEDDARQANRPKILDDFARSAERFLTLRIAKIEVSNRSNMASKNTEISLTEGGVIYAFDEEKRSWLDTKAVIESLPPGASRTFTAILRPNFLDPGILIVHDSKKVEPLPQKLNEEHAWLIPYLNEYPFAVSTVTILALASLLIMTFTVAALLSAPSEVEARAKHTSKDEAKKLVAILDVIKNQYPEKLE